MSVSAIDHVNLLTDDLEATCRFYESVLELRRGESPSASRGVKGAWMFDTSDHPIIHIVVRGSLGSYGEGHEPGLPTNAIHHVAFRCQDFAEARSRIEALGLEHQVNDGMFGLRQIMLKDPNAINIEMNFTGE